MNRSLARASAIAAIAGFGLAQSTPERPAFDVASIKMYADDAPPPKDGTRGIKVSPDGVAWRYSRLSLCMGWAYDIPGRIVGPDWIYGQYDIVAKASAPISDVQLKLMFQRLLEERFKLKVHRETMELPVAVLLVAKNGPKNLQPSKDGDPPKRTAAEGKLSFQGSMTSFADILGNPPPYGVREQVVDQTGLAGLFNLTLNVADFDVNDPTFGGKYVEMRDAAFAFISAALQKQYGLRLEHRKVPLESLVVESGNKVPTEN
jgi:uncharacterized protein (TIGR03435 family)